MSIEISSYSEKWEKEDSELFFYQRRYLKILITSLILLLVIYFFTALTNGLPLIYGSTIIFMIIFLLLRWSEKYIVLGKTYITINNNKFNLTKLLLFTLFFIVYIIIYSNHKNKMTCILLKNIADIIVEKPDILIIKHKVNNETKDFYVDLNLMLPADKNLLLDKMQLIKNNLQNIV